MDNINNTVNTPTLQIPNLKSYMYLMLLQELYNNELYEEQPKIEIEQKHLVKISNK
jgi:hypothetical protein